jgi:hypothetical protein
MYSTLCQRARPPGYFNYDKIFERGTTRLWVILIMGRKTYRKGKFFQGNLKSRIHLLQSFWVGRIHLLQSFLGWDLSQFKITTALCAKGQGIRVILIMTSPDKVGLF